MDRNPASSRPVSASNRSNQASSRSVSAKNQDTNPGSDTFPASQTQTRSGRKHSRDNQTQTTNNQTQDRSGRTINAEYQSVNTQESINRKSNSYMSPAENKRQNDDGQASSSNPSSRRGSSSGSTAGSVWLYDEENREMVLWQRIAFGELETAISEEPSEPADCSTDHTFVQNVAHTLRVPMTPKVGPIPIGMLDDILYGNGPRHPSRSATPITPGSTNQQPSSEPASRRHSFETEATGHSSRGGGSSAPQGYSSHEGGSSAQQEYSNRGGASPAPQGYSNRDRGSSAPKGYSSHGGSSSGRQGYSSHGGGSPAVNEYSSRGGDSSAQSKRGSRSTYKSGTLASSKADTQGSVQDYNRSVSNNASRGRYSSSAERNRNISAGNPTRKPRSKSETRGQYSSNANRNRSFHGLDDSINW